MPAADQRMLATMITAAVGAKGGYASAMRLPLYPRSTKNTRNPMARVLKHLRRQRSGGS